MKLKNTEFFGGDVAFALRSLQLAGKEAPSEFPLLMPGEWKGMVDKAGKQVTLKVTPKNLDDALEYYSILKSRNPLYELPLDYEHQTFSGKEAPAAAWFSLQKKDNWLWATKVNWIPRGKAMVESGEYRFISPAFGFDAPDPVTGKRYSMAVANAALTNYPFLKGELPPLLARDNDVQMFLFHSQPFQEESHMEKVVQFICGFLVLAATATQEEIVAKANLFTEQLRNAGIVAREGTVLTAQTVMEHITGAFTELKTLKANYLLVAKALNLDEKATGEQLVALIAKGTDPNLFVSKTDYQKLLDQIAAKDVDDLINTCMLKGKLTPATKDAMRAFALKDRKSFDELMLKTPDFSVVPLQNIPAGDHQGAGSVSEMDMMVAKNLGVDPEKLKATAAAMAK